METVVLSLANFENVFSASFVGPLVVFLGGFATALLAEPLRQRLFSAKLKLEFESGRPNPLSSPFIVEASSRDIAGQQEKHEVKMMFIRVRVSNIKPYVARSCRAFLINIEKQNEKGVFEQTLYYDSLQLAWASETHDPFREIDLPYGVNKYIDLIQTRSDSNAFHPCTQFTALRLAQDLYTQPATFRFTVLVSGDGLHGQVTKLVFSWEGEWATFAVHQEFDLPGRRHVRKVTRLLARAVSFFTRQRPDSGS